ncbi:MAG: thioredoxin TrxC [Gammaproteobacteria bacterium]
MNTTLSVCPHCSQLNRLPEDRLRAPARCGSCKEPLFSAVPIALDDSRFRRIVERGDVPVLVDFWASWCAPCRIFSPVFESAARDYLHRLVFVKVDTERAPVAAASHNIRSIPSLLLFHSGQELARQVGALDAAALKRFIEGNLATA